LGLLYSKNDVSGISTEKALYQNIEKTPFFNQIAAPEAKIEKNSSYSLKFRQFFGLSRNLKIFDISFRILVSLKKAKGLVFNRG
jgi:hypothetical protein